jgi:hypothetical protein
VSSTVLISSTAQLSAIISSTGFPTVLAVGCPFLAKVPVISPCLGRSWGDIFVFQSHERGENSKLVSEMGRLESTPAREQQKAMMAKKKAKVEQANLYLRHTRVERAEPGLYHHLHCLLGTTKATDCVVCSTCVDKGDDDERVIYSCARPFIMYSLSYSSEGHYQRVIVSYELVKVPPPSQ